MQMYCSIGNAAEDTGADSFAIMHLILSFFNLYKQFKALWDPNNNVWILRLSAAAFKSLYTSEYFMWE